MSDTIKYIIEALRQKGVEPGVTRDPGQLPRRMAGPLGNPVKKTNQDVNYHRYVKMQSDIGESPVSYEEWLRN